MEVSIMKNFTVRVIYRDFREGTENFEVCGLCRLTYLLEKRKDIRSWKIMED